MRLLIFIGMMIVFISVFFSIFIFESMVKPETMCIGSGEAEGCGDGMGAPMIMGLTLIVFFVVIDIMVMIIIYKSLSAEGGAASHATYPAWVGKQ